MSETERKQNLPISERRDTHFSPTPAAAVLLPLQQCVYQRYIVINNCTRNHPKHTHTQSEEKRKIIYCLQSVLLVLPSSSPAKPTTAMAQQQRKNITQHVINCRQITGQKYRPCAWAINCKKDTDLTIVLLTIIFNNPPSPSLSSYTLLSHPFQDD